MDFILPLVRPYLSIFSDPLFTIFAALSLLQLRTAYKVTVSLWRGWPQFSQEPLTAAKKRLADSAAVFTAAPASILIHEFGHALAVWYFGGRVVEFGFFFFFGYVLPDRSFPDVQQWIISIAGTWGNVIFALAAWRIFSGRNSAVLRYFARRIVRFQIVFALITYPLLTAALPVGDWRIIYNFERTPTLSAITAVIHAAILLAYLWLNRAGYFDEATAETADQMDSLTALRQQADANPQDLAVQDKLLGQLLNLNATGEARQRIKKLLANNPNWGSGHLINGLIQADRVQPLPRAAVSSFEKALQAGLPKPSEAALAHYYLGRNAYDREQFAAARQHLNEAVAASNQGTAAEEDKTSSTLSAAIYYLRAVTHRRLTDFEQAGHDIEQAIRLTPSGADGSIPTHLEREREIIQSHKQHTNKNSADKN